MMTPEQRKRARWWLKTAVEAIEHDADEQERSRRPASARNGRAVADALRAVLALIDADEAAEREGGA